MSLNQRVVGSNPTAPTNHINNLAEPGREQTADVLHCVLQFCSRFELYDCNLGKPRVASQIMRIQDRLNVSVKVEFVHEWGKSHFVISYKGQLLGA